MQSNIQIQAVFQFMEWMMASVLKIQGLASSRKIFLESLKMAIQATMAEKIKEQPGLACICVKELVML